MKKLSSRQKNILFIIEKVPGCAISEIQKKLDNPISRITLNRDLSRLVELHCLQKIGKGRAIHYRIHPSYQIIFPVDVDAYFAKETDERFGYSNFNFDVFNFLKSIDLFTSQEEQVLQKLQKEYLQSIKSLSPTLLKKEWERYTIELSWKSAQIEGNTYSILETEALFIEKIEAKNHTKEEAIMLLNHKTTLEFIRNNVSQFKKISVPLLEHIHLLLTKDLNAAQNIRKSGVGITGSFYKPLDNHYQIRESLELMCQCINEKKNIYEKALLAVLLISYIQPFEDGNKRTGRLVANGLLMNGNTCPLSYRSVSDINYKKALLLFYEQNNLHAFKMLFWDQAKFAVNQYF